MATLASSAVVVNETWKGEGTNSRKFLFKDVTLTLTGHGGTTNTIAASVLGLTSIWGVRDARDSDSRILDAAPSYDRTTLVLSPTEQPEKTYVVTGVNGAANITVTGVATTDEIVSVTDLTTPAAKTLSHYSIGSANTVAQAAGAGDTSAKSLLIRTRSPKSGVPTDITGTVRLVVFGKE